MKRRELISKFTRLAFQEIMAQLTIEQLANAFFGSGIGPQQISGFSKPRNIVERIYRQLDFTDKKEMEGLLWVYTVVLHSIDAQSDEYQLLLQQLALDGIELINNQLRFVTVGASPLYGLQHAPQAAKLTVLQREINRMESSIESDPSLAIGTAKELVETCCKTILKERGRNTRVQHDVPKLIKETLDTLSADLLPDNIGTSQNGDDELKRLAGGLITAAHALATIRNLYGSGHGKEVSSPTLDARHARLAVNAASTIVYFLFETHWESSSELS
ncbi:MAG: abortive infection family protein [Anaerolineae bacterium]